MKEAPAIGALEVQETWGRVKWGARTSRQAAPAYDMSDFWTASGASGSAAVAWQARTGRLRVNDAGTGDASAWQPPRRDASSARRVHGGSGCICPGSGRRSPGSGAESARQRSADRGRSPASRSAHPEGASLGTVYQGEQVGSAWGAPSCVARSSTAAAPGAPRAEPGGDAVPGTVPGGARPALGAGTYAVLPCPRGPGHPGAGRRHISGSARRARSSPSSARRRTDGRGERKSPERRRAAAPARQQVQYQDRLAVDQDGSTGGNAWRHRSHAAPPRDGGMVDLLDNDSAHGVASGAAAGRSKSRAMAARRRTRSGKSGWPLRDSGSTRATAPGVAVITRSQQTPPADARRPVGPPVSLPRSSSAPRRRRSGTPGHRRHPAQFPPPHGRGPGLPVSAVN